jgi:hypothetical protein
MHFVWFVLLKNQFITSQETGNLNDYISIVVFSIMVCGFEADLDECATL